MVRRSKSFPRQEKTRIGRFNVAEKCDISAVYFLLNLAAMPPTDVFSDEFVVRWDAERSSLLIVHPDRRRFPQALVQIRSETLAGMDFQAASQFIGERLVLLIPALRERYVDPNTGLLRGHDEV